MCTVIEHAEQLKDVIDILMHEICERLVSSSLRGQREFDLRASRHSAIGCEWTTGIRGFDFRVEEGLVNNPRHNFASTTTEMSRRIRILRMQGIQCTSPSTVQILREGSQLRANGCSAQLRIVLGAFTFIS